MKAAILSWLSIPCLRRRKRRRRAPAARDIDDFGVETDFNVIPTDVDDFISRGAVRGSSLPAEPSMLTSTTVDTTASPYPAQPPPAYSCVWPQQQQAVMSCYDYGHIQSSPVYASATTNIAYPHPNSFPHSVGAWPGTHHFPGWWPHPQPAPASPWIHQPPMQPAPPWSTTYPNGVVASAYNAHGHFGDTHTYGTSMQVGLEGSAGSIPGYGIYEHFNNGQFGSHPFPGSESSSPMTPLRDSRPVSSSPRASSHEEDSHRVELPSFDATIESRNDTCAICLSLLREGKVSAGPCKHVMHTACLKLWLCRDRHGACPVCRVPYDNADWVRQPFARSSSSVASASTAFTQVIVRPVAEFAVSSP